MIEKRQYKRLSVELPVTLRCRGKLIPATVLNISTGGVCLETDDVVANTNDKVEVVVDLDKRKKDVSLCGEVVRAEETGENDSVVGIKFDNFSTSNFKSLKEFLVSNLD